MCVLPMILVSVVICFFIGVGLIALSALLARISDEFLLFLLCSSFVSGIAYFALNIFATTAFPLSQSYALLCGYLGVFGVLGIFLLGILPI